MRRKERGAGDGESNGEETRGSSGEEAMGRSNVEVWGGSKWKGEIGWRQ